MVAYKVGCGDEEKDQTGLSHYLEHLLFKGTDKLMPGDIDRATQRNGGREQRLHVRGHDRLPLRLRRRPLADRAGDRGRPHAEHPHRREARVRAGEGGRHRRAATATRTSPGTWSTRRSCRCCSPKDSPYSHPVIGEREHVRGATAEIIKRHYDQWYHPNNAALVIVGGFDPDEALAKIKKLFGPIPKGDLPPRKAADRFKDRAGPSARSSSRSSTCRGC